MSVWWSVSRECEAIEQRNNHIMYMYSTYMYIDRTGTRFKILHYIIIWDSDESYIYRSCIKLLLPKLVGVTR